MRTVLPVLCAIGVAAGLPPLLHGQAGRTLRGIVTAGPTASPSATPWSDCWSPPRRGSRTPQPPDASGSGHPRASASGFDSQWSASGQIPRRAVAGGLISRFGALDDSEGGGTSRYDLSVGLRSTAGAERRWEARAYAVKYAFSLFSNFTFFLDDPVRGDGINQTDDRWIAGANGSYGLPSRLWGAEGRTTVGLGVRSDWTDVGLHRSVGRTVRAVRVEARVSERHGFAWIRQDLRLAPAVRLQLGARADLFHFDVLDRLEGTPSDLPHASGSRTEGL